MARDRDALTARQVHERRGRSVDILLAECRRATTELAPALSERAPMPGGLSPIVTTVVVNDIVVHEGDLRQAVGLGTAPKTLDTSLALAGYGASLDRRQRMLGLPAVSFAYDGKSRQFGGGDPIVRVTADRTTLVRLLASRLGVEEMLVLEWSGDPIPYLTVLPEYGPAKPAGARSDERVSHAGVAPRGKVGRVAGRAVVDCLTEGETGPGFDPIEGQRILNAPTDVLRQRSQGRVPLGRHRRQSHPAPTDPGERDRRPMATSGP